MNRLHSLACVSDLWKPEHRSSRVVPPCKLRPLRQAERKIYLSGLTSLISRHRSKPHGVGRDVRTCFQKLSRLWRCSQQPSATWLVFRLPEGLSAALPPSLEQQPPRHLPPHPKQTDGHTEQRPCRAERIERRRGQMQGAVSLTHPERGAPRHRTARSPFSKPQPRTSSTPSIAVHRLHKLRL